MNRTMIVAAVALLIAGVTYPILALDSNKNSEPAKIAETKDDGKAVEVKPVEPMATEATVPDPAVTGSQEMKMIEPVAKDTTTTEPGATQTKPTVPTPSNPSAANNGVIDAATNAVKDKVTDAAKEKAADAAPSVMTTTPDAVAPAAK